MSIKELQNLRRIVTEPDSDTFQLPFTAVPNEVLDHPEITARGKLLMVYLLKHAGIPGWQYNDACMQKFLECGRNCLEAAFRGLRDAGYVTNVILYDSRGRVFGSKRIFSRIPKFLELNRSKLKVVPIVGDMEKSIDAPKTGAPTHRGPENRGILKRKMFKNKNIKNNNNNSTAVECSMATAKKQKFHVEHEPVVRSKRTTELKPIVEDKQPDGCVVVDSEIENLMNQARGWTVSRFTLSDWVRKHGARYVKQKIELTKTAISQGKVRKKGAYLNNAITLDWMPLAPPEEGKEVSSKPVERVYPTHDENVGWYGSLTQDEKLEVCQEAVYKHPPFEGMLQHQKVTVLDKDFSQHSLFKTFMSILSRAR